MIILNFIVNLISLIITLIMNFGNNSGVTTRKEYQKREETPPDNSADNQNISHFGSIIRRSRLSEQDLLRFEQEIIIAHRKRNYQALTILGIILVFLAVLLFIFMI